MTLNCLHRVIYLPHSGANVLSCWNAVKHQLSLSLSLSLTFVSRQWLPVYDCWCGKTVTTLSREVSSNAMDKNDISDRSFVVAGSRIWNGLPVALRDALVTLSASGRELKTPLFWFSCTCDLQNTLIVIDWLRKTALTWWKFLNWIQSNGRPTSKFMFVWFVCTLIKCLCWIFYSSLSVNGLV